MFSAQIIFIRQAIGGGYICEVLIVYLCLFVITDYKKGIIPNKLLVLGVIHRLLFKMSLWNHIIVILIIFVVFFPFFKSKMLGAGDIKLFMLIGLYLTPRETIISIAVSFFIAAIISIAKLILFCKEKSLKVKIHMALPIFIGTMITVGGIVS